MQYLKTELSVFFALITVLCAALVLSCAESVRTQASRAYLTIAANSAADSLFSQYHRELWDRYRLLGLEMYSEKEICSEYYGFLSPYLQAGYTKNWYCLTGSGEGIELSETTLLTDKGGEIFEKEVVDYMKYGILSEIPDLLSMKETGKIFTEGNSVTEVASGFSDCAVLCGDLEETVSDIGKTVKQAESLQGAVSRAIGNRRAESVCTQAEELRKVWEKLAHLSGEYAENADRLQEAIAEKEASLETEYRKGNLGEETYARLKSDLSCYDAYLSEEGERRKEIMRLPEIASGNCAVLKETEELAREAESLIENFEPEEILIGYGPPLTEGGPPEPLYGETSMDEEEVWAPVRQAFSAYRKEGPDIEERKPDLVKKAQLENIAALLKGDLLSLVLPEGVSVSEEPLPMENRPSEKYAFSEEECGNENRMTERLFVNEYDLKVMNDFSKALRPLETEYILYGKESDRENLRQLTGELTAVRTGLNLLYLLSDNGKKEEARVLAMAITGAAAVTPLLQVTVFLILSTWALGQAVKDVKDLYAGGKVPFVHDSETFCLTLEKLLTDFTGALQKEGSGERGLSYQEYLRIFLFLHQGSAASVRALDVIQMNLRRAQPDFLAERLYTAVRLGVRADSRHLFGMIFSGGTFSGSYPVRVTTCYAY